MTREQRPEYVRGQFPPQFPLLARDLAAARARRRARMFVVRRALAVVVVLALAAVLVAGFLLAQGGAPWIAA